MSKEETTVSRNDLVVGWFRRQPRKTRNVVRAWLIYWMENGKAATAPVLAWDDALGLTQEGIWRRLSAMENGGGVIYRTSESWESARPAPGVSPAALLAAVGRDLEEEGVASERPQTVHECDVCGCVNPPRRGCPLCSLLRRRPPGWLDRLVAMAARAGRREPLEAPGLPPVGEFPAGAEAEEDDEAA